MTLVQLVITILLLALIPKVWEWLTTAPQRRSDPWGPEYEQMLEDPALPELCHRCLTPHGSEGWFCPCCGAAIGPYNNWMPYINVFSEGEVLRAGVTAPVNRSWVVMGGYFVYSLVSYSLFAPWYWYWFLRNLNREPEQGGNAEAGSASSPPE